MNGKNVVERAKHVIVRIVTLRCATLGICSAAYGRGVAQRPTVIDGTAFDRQLYRRTVVIIRSKIPFDESSRQQKRKKNRRGKVLHNKGMSISEYS
jgi:hypothetical protein